MQIIIPMSGTGRRHIEAGYKEPKPLIKVDGKPIIEHVVNQFPGETDFIFICNKNHLAQTNMAKILRKIAPQGKIIGIPRHKKGPVYAVSKVFNLINDEEEAFVVYCDVGKYWDYKNFLSHTRSRNADAALSANRGFHPHMIGNTNYALIKDEDQWMKKITEKKPLDDLSTEFSSDGCHYFRRGAYIKKYFQLLMDKDIHYNGEFYVSMVFNLLKEDNLKISVYEIEHMLNWGVPSDLDQYLQWSDYFKKIVLPQPKFKAEAKSINLIPLAGRGSRFADAGYKTPKPLIEVNGLPMVVQATRCAPPAKKNIFVCLQEHLKKYPLKKSILHDFPKAVIVSLDHVTEGQACTCEMGLKDVDPEAPLFIGACDNGMLWDSKKYQQLLKNKSIDVIAWSQRHHPLSRVSPQSFGWIKVDKKDNIQGVSVKIPISKDPYNDHAIVGAFYFRKVKYFLDALNRLRELDQRVNNEFYADSCVDAAVNLGLKAKVFEIDHFISWGTPNDLLTYQYWQSYFHKNPDHPYTLEKDLTMNQTKIKKLNQQYRNFRQKCR